MRGREFKQASICVSTVANSSKVRRTGETIFLRWVLTLLTFDSQRPPKCGDFSGMNRHSIPFVLQISDRAPCVEALVSNVLS